HSLLEQFLRLIGVDEERIYNDVEGIEHHLSWNSIECIADLIQVLEENPDFIHKMEELKAHTGE
ncbi:MAG TPA: iron dependent repressor, metal binding and dimerization domain protein, partial [Rummeliibacillus sp.]|nr:iron dependent repressor, metal binding and dimerization domain protein [Rummeliibacillus sp.]